MNYLKLVFFLMAVAGCAQKPVKPAPEVVASCFSDGDNQERYCKAQRIAEDGKLITTRCIGDKNREANVLLRGKCVEKICSRESNTDCFIKGEPLVLKQYEELLVSEHFVDESAATEKKNLKKKKKRKKVAQEIDVDPSVRLNIPEPAEASVKPTKKRPKAAKKAAVKPVKEPEMVIILKPTRPSASPASSVVANPKNPSVEKARSPASQAPPDGFVKACVAKNDLRAPQAIRGKCATRNCTKGRCSYNGAREIFDYKN